MRITEMELDVLLGIYNSEYQDCDGEDTIDNPTWSFSIESKTQGKTLSGVCSSLVKKGLAGAQKSIERKGNNDVIWLTREGYNTLINNKLIKERN